MDYKIKHLLLKDLFDHTDKSLHKTIGKLSDYIMELEDNNNIKTSIVEKYAREHYFDYDELMKQEREIYEKENNEI